LEYFYLPDVNDVKLAVMASKGDMNAFEQLVMLYFTGITGVCYSITANRQDAEDCAQEAFIKAYRNISKFDPSSSFFTWIYRIAVNTCYDLKRKENRKYTVSLDDTMETEDGAIAYQIEDNSAAIDDQLICEASDQKIQSIIDMVPEKFSRILRLKDIDGLSYIQIAQIEDINEGTVKSRLSRARAAFAQLAKDEDLYV
jgi:RNA polymerase sigma-70 factor (ECF subfamily)